IFGQRAQQGALAGNGFRQGEIPRGQRMLATRLAEPLDEHLVPRLDEQQLGREPGRLEALQYRRELREALRRVARIDADRDLAVERRPRVAHLVGELLEEIDGEVVDAVIAGVLQCVQGYRLPCTR